LILLYFIKVIQRLQIPLQFSGLRARVQVGSRWSWLISLTKLFIRNRLGELFVSVFKFKNYSHWYSCLFQRLSKSFCLSQVSFDRKRVFGV